VRAQLLNAARSANDGSPAWSLSLIPGSSFSRSSAPVSAWASSRSAQCGLAAHARRAAASVSATDRSASVSVPLRGSGADARGRHEMYRRTAPHPAPGPSTSNTWRPIPARCRTIAACLDRTDPRGARVRRHRAQGQGQARAQGDRPPLTAATEIDRPLSPRRLRRTRLPTGLGFLRVSVADGILAARPGLGARI
jgi:hypothetical protein